MKYGYTRVSTEDQNSDMQLTALKRAGYKTIPKDEGISRATTKRPALARCLKALHAGDTFITEPVKQSPSLRIEGQPVFDLRPSCEM